MRRSFSVRAIGLLLFLFLSGLSWAQTGPEVIDVRPFAPADGSSVESVALSNGSLRVNIPIWSFSQRGKLKLDFNLAYDGGTFTQSTICVPSSAPTPINAINSIVPDPEQTVSYTSPVDTPDNKPIQPCLNPHCGQAAVCIHWGMTQQPGIRFVASTNISVLPVYSVVNAASADSSYYWKVITPDGGSHNLAKTSIGDWRSVDGTGWEFSQSNCNLRDNEGIVYVFDCPSGYSPTGVLPGRLQYEEDTNGNRITLNYSQSEIAAQAGPFFVPISWTDTLGRTIPAPVSEDIPSNCPPGTTIAAIWAIPGVSSGVHFCSVPVQLQTAGSTDGSTPIIADTPVLPMISRVILPSGDAWTFSYNVLPGDSSYGTQQNYGNLSQIILPTGGTIQYTWGGLPVSCPANGVVTYRPSLWTRSLRESSLSPSSTWNYELQSNHSLSDSSILPSIVNTVTDPNGNVAVHTLTRQDGGAPGSCAYYESSVQQFDSIGNLLKKESSEFQKLPATPYVLQMGEQLNAVLPSAKHEIWPDGTSRTTTYAYDAGFIAIDDAGTHQVPIGSQLTQTDYDFSTNSTLGTPLRTKTTTYAWQSNSGFLSANLLEIPASVDILDVAKGRHQTTTYGYDESALTSGNASTSWDVVAPNGAIRGNQTSVLRYLDTASSNLTTTITYTNTGMVSSITLPHDASTPDTTTTYGWSADYQGALLTSETDALGHTTSYTYNPLTALPVNMTDPNNTVTTYTYYGDTRLRSVTSPATSAGQGVTEYHYPAPTHVEKHVLQGSGVWLRSDTYYDGLGRLVSAQTQNACASGPSSVDTTYDLLDRVQTVSSPHCPGLALATDGITTYQYDALNRRILQQNPDATWQSWSYFDDSTTFTDENQSSWTRTNDALGRLATVVESGGLTTSYLYDAFGNLTNVNQQGNTQAGEIPRTRTFTYDSLSRLLTSSNPETGTICYGQWASGAQPNLTLPGGPPGPGGGGFGGGSGGHSTGPCPGGYDAHGNLLYKTDANGVTLSYTYDALNRLVGKSASDGSVNDTNTYDQGSYGIGRLTSAANGSVSNSFTYDALGRVVGVGYSLPASGGTSLQTSMAVGYDLAGNETSLTYPDGRVVTQSFDAAGRLAKVSSEGTDYISGGAGAGIAYWPSGTEQSFTLGNGVAQTNLLNNRLQPCHTWAVSSVLPVPTPGVGNLFDRQSFFNASLSSPCGNEAGNNGNIFAITDNLNQGWNRGFTYDALNRLTSASRADGGYNHTYNYDSFGNMTVQDNLNANNPTWWIDPATNRLLRNPVFFSSPGGSGGSAPSASDYTYDAAGNLISNGTSDSCAPGVNGTSGNCGHTFAYNALNQVLSVDSGNAANYVYNGMDERVYKSTPSGWTQYMYFNSQPMAEYDNNGIWTDYVYANGQKIAKVQSAAPVWHLSGVGTGSTDCGAQYWVTGTPAPVAGTQIAAGDQLVVDMKAIGAHMDFLLLIDGSAWTDTVDQDGYSTMDYARTDGAWHHRIIDLAPWVGHTATALNVGIQQYGPAGQDDVWMRNAALVRADGSVLPIFNGAPVTMTSWNGVVLGSTPTDTCVVSGLTLDFNNAPLDDTVNTNYYLDDKLGTAQVELSSGGWPLWQGQFTPFGAELPDGATSMHYKFTGKERDTESGLDYFGARYYASNMGRWMSPDWADKPEAVPYSSLDNPQSLNLYGYVGNNPLSRADADGHQWPDCTCSQVPNYSAAWDSFVRGARQTAGDFGRSVARDYQVTKIIVTAVASVAASQVAKSLGTSSVAPTASSGAKPEIVIDGNQHPESAQHAADAQAAGHPADVTIDRGGAAGNRADALRGTPAVPGAHRDEYPPAVTTQGGSGASVRPISPSDNAGAGASMGNQMRPYPDGTTVTIRPINVPKPPQ